MNQMSTSERSEVPCNAMLQACVKRIMDLKHLKMFVLSLTDTKLKMCTYWKKIEDKIDNHMYSNADEFWADLTKMKENAFSDLADKKVLLKKAKHFLECCEADVKLIKSCAECYWKEVTDETDNWFTEVCSKPHMVAMVKTSRGLNVPAKIMCYDEQNVFIRYFTNFHVMDVPYHYLSPYTRAMRSSARLLPSVKNTFKEANLYIDNVINRFGCYNFCKSLSRPQDLTHHLNNFTRLTSAASISARSNPSRNLDDGPVKRIKLENQQLHRKSNDDQSDSMSVDGNIGDESISEDDVESSEQAIRTNARVTTSVSIQRRSTMSTAQSPPRLRDCSSRCETRNHEAETNFLKDEIEKMKRDHAVEISTVTNTFLGMIEQMRTKHEAEKLATKKKQWCSHCWQEAKLYCCWETSYCDNLCQRKHWWLHSTTCLNQGEVEEEEE